MPLYLVATPIGNLSDISLRALETLRSSDLILCEDTRTSLRLLKHYQIQSPLASYHKFNELEQLKSVLQMLHDGKAISLISDAGTPCINDPGQILIRHCKQQSLEVIAVPGACSVITALISSGLNCSHFQFLGFAPKERSKREAFLKTACDYPGTSLFFETSPRLKVTLEILCQIVPDREIALLKELTKRYEQQWLLKAVELFEKFQSIEPRGEWVVAIGANQEESLPTEIKQALASIEFLESKGLSRRDSIISVSTLLGVSSQELYRHLN